MGKRDSLGERMKEDYENRSKTFLTRKTPAIIRIDGKAFHSYTKGFKRPYDEIFHSAMNKTTEYLCKNIQGCKLGYTQSDEISLLLVDYDTITTEAWFDYNVQKICSVAASMATAIFNEEVLVGSLDYTFNHRGEDGEYIKDLDAITNRFGLFDCRVFSVPKEEVANYFIWRQQDCERNAVEMLGRCHFSDKEMYKKSNSEVRDMLMKSKNIDFEDMPAPFKKGVCCIKGEDGWKIDLDIPIFTQNRNYIERFVNLKPAEEKLKCTNTT